MAIDPPPLAKHRRVVLVRGDAPAHSHDVQTKASLAASLARLLDADYAGSVDARRDAVGGAYAVPCQTLTQHEASRLGIGGVHDLFGGVVPQPFVATKTITHALVAPDARARGVASVQPLPRCAGAAAASTSPPKMPSHLKRSPRRSR